MEDSMEKLLKEKWNDILEFMKTEDNTEIPILYNRCSE